jgi:glycosyltransferase involved in cell wall biosynthesis
MRILCFMPRNMRFGPSNATSIDLCVHDLIAASRYRNETKIVCCENETLFSGLDVTTYPREVDRRKSRKITFALKNAVDNKADLIVVQQHMPTAAAVARRINTPVILYKHNMTKPIPKTGVFNRLKHLWRVSEYNRLAGIIFVSEACQKIFQSDWPEIKTPMGVVNNGLDFSEWQPAEVRRKEIICVGRAAPEKGIKEAAEGIAAILSSNLDWSARLILSEPARFPDYLQSVKDAIKPVADRVSIDLNQRFAFVRERLQEAAIAIIPSKWEEPFGRTALEAHAGGCAVITSGTGGLAEISGDHALYLRKGFNGGDVGRLLSILVGDEAKRNELARDGRDRCMQKFSVGSVAADADRFYDRIMQVTGR